MLGSYRPRVWKLVQEMLQESGSFSNALDFGSGDGWFAVQFQQAGLARRVDAVDVTARPRSLVVPQLYDGRTLPFASRSFDLVYAIDVLHHCPEPEVALAELLRCCGRACLIKDHTYQTRLGYATLCVMDEIGNRRFGIPCRYRYQHRRAWDAVLQREGFHLRRRIGPARCHCGPVGALMNRMEYLALWERNDASQAG